MRDSPPMLDEFACGFDAADQSEDTNTFGSVQDALMPITGVRSFWGRRSLTISVSSSAGRLVSDAIMVETKLVGATLPPAPIASYMLLADYLLRRTTLAVVQLRQAKQRSSSSSVQQ